MREDTLTGTQGKEIIYTPMNLYSSGYIIREEIIKMGLCIINGAKTLTPPSGKQRSII